MPKRELPLIETIDKVPVVGPLWADVLTTVLGMSDALNLRGLRDESLAGPTPRRSAPPADASAESLRRVA